MITKYFQGQRVSLYGSCPEGTREGRIRGTITKVFNAGAWEWDRYEVAWDNETISIMPTSRLDPLE